MSKFRAICRPVLLVTVLASGALAGCGGEQTDSNASATSVGTSVGTTTGTPNDTTSTPVVSTSSDLAISGTPSGSATIGTAYSFLPKATGASAVTFAIVNKPTWAAFDASTGALTGTPATGDLGDYNGVVISATTGRDSAELPSFRITVAAAKTSGSATLSWIPPTHNTDGSSVTNLGGYVIYLGRDMTAMNTRIEITNSGLTSYTVSGLESGTHYFGISAYTTNGVESEMSGIGSKTIM